MAAVVENQCVPLYFIQVYFLLWTSFKVFFLICPFSVHPIRAIISEIYGLSCSCPLCGRDSSYHWYHRNDDQLWASMGFNSNYFTPKASGSYACRAVWTNGRSFLSNSYACELLLPFLDIFVTHMVNLSRCELRSL